MVSWSLLFTWSSWLIMNKLVQFSPCYFLHMPTPSFSIGTMPVCDIIFILTLWIISKFIFLTHLLAVFLFFFSHRTIRVCAVLIAHGTYFNTVFLCWNSLQSLHCVKAMVFLFNTGTIDFPSSWPSAVESSLMHNGCLATSLKLCQMDVVTPHLLPMKFVATRILWQVLMIT